MKSIEKKLYITYSNQKARDIRDSSSLGVFDKVTTLSSLMFEIYEKNSFEYLIDETIASSIIYKIIQMQQIRYFDYLQSDAGSLMTIFDFMMKCKRSNVAFERFASGEKLAALQKIEQHYEEYKKSFMLADIADIEIKAVELFEKAYFNDYVEIYVDSFHLGEIDFLESKKQEEFLSKISVFATALPYKRKEVRAKILKPSHEVFDRYDEVRTAIKIARKLLEEGIDSSEILIVASNINEYAPAYKLLLNDFALSGYSSVATPLTQASHLKDEKSLQAISIYKRELKKMQELYKRLGLTLSDGVKERLKENIKIADEKIGIEMTEPNQLVGLSKTYKHIIFVGTDINHFPLPAQDNFLYSYEESLECFYVNNYFLSSQTQLEELKSMSEYLYIITASYSGKRELSRSILIKDTFDSEIDVSKILSRDELALKGEVVQRNANEENYFKSISSNEFTAFDGVGVEGVNASHLSASQINKYLSCPLAYLYASKLKLKAPQQTQEGFDAMDQGSLMHLCFELFGREIKEKKILSKESQELYELMFLKSIEAYESEETLKNRGEENIQHRIFLLNLQAGLKDERDKGLLAKFVDYYITNAEEFNYFLNSEFEKEFALDSNLKPYELQGEEDKSYFIKGFIDRFDDLDGYVNIIDYKSKKMSSKIDKAKQEEVEQLRDVQLALYILYTSQHYPNKEHNAHLLSFKGDGPYYHFANLSTKEDIKETIHYSPEYNEELKRVVYGVKEKIEAGEFAFNNSEETACGYCDMRFICHQSVLSKTDLIKDL